MALTQITTKGIKDGTILGADLTTNVDLVDNQKIRFGTGNDLQIYHSGSHSFIKNSGTGVLHIQGNNSNDLKISPRDDEDSIIAKNNGSVELYHNGSKKFETMSTGAYVEGYLAFPDNGGLKIGSGNDLQIFHNGSHSFIRNSGTGVLHIQGNNSNDLKISPRDDEDSIVLKNNGAVELYHNGSKKLETISTGLQTAEVVKMLHSVNGVNIKQVFEQGVGNTATCTAQVPECVGGGTVTVTVMHNGNNSITTTKMFPIMIQGAGTANLGSEIFSINANSAASMSVSAATRGVTVTNNAGAHAKVRVTFDITANA